ncbi:phage tail assembly protein [Photobacterium atrarenae]|uniref:Phage tail assembly protein n=1 Tax=Photobacterium atrarenae TaxID=865757 RepID=A0ABY5GB24_9GAMM|nr:phage tail assembly protein [Photobacterium atrarenae]UTV26376.1 phage tail assembly protein [Photobacterium atrarenae]
MKTQAATQANTATYPNPAETITLDYPVRVEGKEYQTLTMRRLKVRDRLIANKQEGDDFDKELYIFSSLTGVDVTVIHELDEMDYKKLQDVYLGFMKKGSQNSASETSSTA